MGDVKVTKADYIVGTQTIDVKGIIDKLKSDNYGAIQLPVAKLDADLRKENRILAKPDEDALKLTPPHLIVDYTDETGVPHHVETPITGELTIGNRSTVGKMIQTPGDIFWSFALVATRIQFVVALILFWTIVVVGTFKQWTYLGIELTPGSGAASNPLTYTTDNYGILGKWVMLIISGLLAATSFMTSKIDGLIIKFFGPAWAPAYGWFMRLLMTLSSGFAPVSGFFFQLLLWFTTVNSIEAWKANPESKKPFDPSGLAKLVPGM